MNCFGVASGRRDALELRGGGEVEEHKPASGRGLREVLRVVARSVFNFIKGKNGGKRNARWNRAYDRLGGNEIAVATPRPPRRRSIGRVERSLLDTLADEAVTCNVCDRAFATVRVLEQHQRKKRHWGCSICERLFNSEMLLEHHKEEYEHWSDASSEQDSSDDDDDEVGDDDAEADHGGQLHEADALRSEAAMLL